ncbi:hypothetical protein Spica_2345 [Gracilinema caldarium DSM 7334]|uniref:Methyl-accepting transducer domain-containing protein n=2 Tax=Gracilinema caldarium TaxID=215591 RepID=F8F3T7_GRAC1|nr:hypothetical protein Spica_2345 [Gracilinema caldarium DSM 7334]
MTKYNQLIIFSLLLLIFCVFSLLFIPMLLWVFLIGFGIWMFFFIRTSKNLLREIEISRDALKKVFQSVEPDVNLHDITDFISSYVTISDSIVSKIQALQQENRDIHEKVTRLQTEMESLHYTNPEIEHLCSLHIPIDIKDRWQMMIQREWGKVNQDALKNLNDIKRMNDENQEFISEVFREFGVQQATFTDFTKKYQQTMQSYTQRATHARNAITEDLKNSAHKIEETFHQFSLIEDITEKIRMISLNLSIEASKVRGAESFSFLARELRRLSQNTEETLKGIGISIAEAIQELNKSRSSQEKELRTLDEVLQQFQGLLKEYDTASEKLSVYMQKSIERINTNQVEQKTILLQFFTALQQIAIVKEELEHQVSYYFIFLEKANEYVQKILRNSKTCKGFACPQRRAMLEELAKIANTDEERRMVNDLFDEFLNEDREADHGSLVGDINDFISF